MRCATCQAAPSSRRSRGTVEPRTGCAAPRARRRPGERLRHRAPAAATRPPPVPAPPQEDARPPARLPSSSQVSSTRTDAASARRWRRRRRQSPASPAAAASTIAAAAARCGPVVTRRPAQGDHPERAQRPPSAGPQRRGGGRGAGPVAPRSTAAPMATAASTAARLITRSLSASVRSRRAGGPSCGSPDRRSRAGTIVTSPSPVARRQRDLLQSARAVAPPGPGARTTSMADANWLCAAARRRPAASASASTRAGTSTAELACRVPQPPSWPVLSAASRSTTSAPRTSPTTSRSGRIRRACRTSVRTVISPAPSTLAGRASSVDHVRVVGPELGGVLDDAPAAPRRVTEGQQRATAGWSCRCRCRRSPGRPGGPATSAGQQRGPARGERAGRSPGRRG